MTAIVHRLETTPARPSSDWHAQEVLVYKILLPSEWDEFNASGQFDGSPFDARSGFVHCSSRAQVGSTAKRFFSEEPALVVLALDTQVLGDAVRWEPASNGEQFPHVYGSLPLSAVVTMYSIPGAALVEDALGSSDALEE
jgi:uncharacterized protein (DUF952 family)